MWPLADPSQCYSSARPQPGMDLEALTSQSYLSSFEAEYAREISFADLILVQMFSDRDFICGTPQLGIEDEQGGTTIDWSTQPSALQQPS